jgi:hypothetical protein
MCVAELAVSKMYNDRKDRKSRERINNSFANAPKAPPSDMAIKKPEPISKPTKPKTNINTGMNIGGRF